MKPLLLEPISDYTIWGSNHLSTIRNKEKNYGTWWEVSAHPYCTNPITNLEIQTCLQDIIDQDPEGILGPGLDQHDILRLAYLDTQDALSIQVHPEDDYALQNAHDYGKYESWYIIDAKPHATLVAGTTTKDTKTIQEALKKQELEPFLQKWEVKKGDYITIPAGMLHALGKDIWALEIGTNSNTTYRFYDYGRKDAQGNLRPLHIQESFDVTDFSKQPTFVHASKTSRRIGQTPFFTVDEVYLEKDQTWSLTKHYLILSNIEEREVILHWKQETMILPAYGSCFVPYNAKEITIEKGAHILLSQPVKEDL